MTKVIIFAPRQNFTSLGLQNFVYKINFSKKVIFVCFCLIFSMASDFNLVCRCCRRHSDNMMELTATAPNLESTFEEILTRITEIDRKPQSGPSKICVQCSEVLIAADELRLLTIESDKFFRTLYDDVKVEKQEVDEDLLEVVERDQPILFEEVETEIEDDVSYEDDSSGTEVPKGSRSSKKKINVKSTYSPTT
jgi:Zinc-finger associated domain (zf-AD)